MNETELGQAFDEAWSKSSERNWIYGRLGKLDGGVYTFDVPGMPGYKYVNKGTDGTEGLVTAIDRIGVAATGGQQVKMRRERGHLIIREAEEIAGGSGGGASDLNALTDVTLTTPANGQTLQYNAATSQWINVVPAGGAGGAPSPHAHSSIHHTGLLPWVELNKTGSSLSEIETRPHSLLSGITPDQHHNQAHVLATGTALGADHTISGAAAGEVLRALGPTTAAFDVLQHTDLGNILPDQHHAQVHNITGTDHTITGSQFQVVGATAVNTLGLLTPSSAPGAAAALLRTDANGGIQLDTNLFYVDGANNRIGVNVVPGAGPLGGAAAFDMRAANTGDITQRIRQLAGQTQRLWRVEGVGGNELIVLDSVGNLQSGNPGFVSGLLGWQITPEGNAEFNNIWARGELHATVFVKDEVHATGGTLLVATAGVLHDDANISSSAIDDDVLYVYSTAVGMGVPLQVVTTSGAFVGTDLHVSFIGNTININDPPSGPGFYFQPGDVVRSKTEVDTGVTDFWLEVNNAVQNSGYSTYSVTKRSGTDGTLPKGSAVVSYGRQGDGRILMTSDLNYAPYIDVFTVGPNVWTGAAGSVVPRMRMGRLDGIGLPGISGVPQYGMIAGKDLSDANSGYLIASNLQFSLYKVDIRLNDGSNDTGLWTANGNLRIGKNVGADATTGFRVYTIDGGGYNAGDVVIGNTSTGNFLRWNQLSGTLQVVGSLVVSDPGTTVTLKYVDDQDKSYDLAAVGYGSTAQTNAQNYSNATRISGVTGTWTSTAANIVTWASLTATFVNGGSRTIAAGSTGSMSVRTYLYVDTSLSGTLIIGALTTPDTIHPSYALIAVCDPGTPRASVTVVAGTTFISGSNIATGSIQANHLVANSIDTGQLTVTYNNAINTISSTATTANAAAGTAQTTANTANSAANAAQTTANTANSAAGTAQTTANNAQTAADAAAADAAAAQVYGDSRRVVGVSGTWTVIDGNTIAWGAPNPVQVKFANGNVKTITAETAHNLSGTAPSRRYLFVDVTAAAPLTMFDTFNIGAITANYALIAVVDVGTLMASIHIVAGSTYISGGNIMTGSIVATNIAAATISADKMNVQRLSAMKGTFGALLTGVIEMDSASNIHTTGKTSWEDTTAGVFLGWDTTPNAGYKFGIGDANNYIQWGGSGFALSLRTTGGLDLFSTGDSATIIRFLSGLGNISLRHTHNDPIRTSRIRSDGVWAFDFELYADKLINTGATFWMAQVQRAVPSNISAGHPGEMCWSYDGVGNLWLYLCYTEGFWRRIQFPTTAW